MRFCYKGKEVIVLLDLIVNRDKIKETYLFANDTEFKIIFNSSDWYRLSKKAIFVVEGNTYMVENLEDNHTYPLPAACIGTDFSVFITGESANSYKETDKLPVRIICAAGGGSEEYASKAIYSDNAVSLGRREGTDIGNGSVALGNNVTATGSYSHAEGDWTSAIGSYSHVEGSESSAVGQYSHAEGQSHAYGYFSHAEGRQTVASGYYSHAEGYNTTASGDSSHAEGEGAEASGYYSHAEGYWTKALDYQHAQGYLNDNTIATANAGMGVGEGTAFVIGNGVLAANGRPTKSNAFRIDYNGKVFAKSEYASTGADYAEYFEWLDGNKNDEDRRGFFVTMDGDKIKKANTGDYILGIVSGQPAVLGNNDECYMGRYEMDEFGAYIEEEISIEVEKTNSETGETYKEQATAKRFKEKDTYNPTLPYVPRAKRKEWNAVGMLGVLSVRDDGTCEVNGYCKCGSNGIATKSDTGYRVISRVNENIVRAIFK